MSKSSRLKKNNKAIRDSKEKRKNQIAAFKEDVRFKSNKFLSADEELELRMKQQGLI